MTTREWWRSPSEPASPQSRPEPPLPPPPVEPPSPAGLTPSTEPRGLRAHPGHAAVDFGTTSTTVTLYDTGVRRLQALSPDQRRRMCLEFAALLGEEPDGPADLQTTWDEVRRDLANRVRPDDGTTLRDALETAGAADGEPGVIMDRIVAELERLRDNRGEALRRFLTPRLERCYASALDVLPLDTLRLFRVFLDGRVADELPSIVYDTGRRGDQRFTMLPPAGGPGGDDAAIEYRGLKQQLGRRRPRVAQSADGPGLEDLIGGALGDLVNRSDVFLNDFRDDLSLGPGVVNKVILTYPTMAPVSVRDTLCRLLTERGLGEVDTRFDEAIAAAMFAVLSEFGGTYEISVEAFASRCRPVGRRPGDRRRPSAWQENVLIVDVGGGTTDVALLRLELRDETDPTNPGAESSHYGRFFRLRPTVLGTTGESQRGGDFLTLQVFRWIKVLLADHLLLREPQVVASVVPDLGQRYLDSGGGYIEGRLVTSGLTGPTWLHTAARAAGHVVPTSWRAVAAGAPGKEADREQLFLRLWTLASETKKLLGTQDEVILDPVTVRNLLRSVREMHGGAVSEPPDLPTLRLSRTDFERLVGEEVANVMELAAALARVQLEGDLPDRVILTGRGALLPLVGRELKDALARREGDELVRQPEIMSYPDGYAKHAASIGACWAASTDRRSQENLHERLERGVTWLTLDVDNLFRSLRGSFEVIGPPGSGPEGAIPLFDAGDALRPPRPGDEPMARSKGWIQYDGFRVHRRKVPGRYVPLRGRSTLHWASFGVRDYLQAHPIPGFTLRAGQELELFIQVEVTASLDMTALVCHGQNPHFVLSEARSASKDLFPALGETTHPLEDIPITILADPDQGGTTQDMMDEPVFAAGDPFDVVLLADAAGNEVRRARISSRPLSPPQGTTWQFCRRDIDPTGAKVDVRLDTVAPPAGSDPTACWAILDEYGYLYVVEGEPTYRRADNLAQVFETPGVVLRAPMTSEEPDYDPNDDPFTGLQ